MALSLEQLRAGFKKEENQGQTSRPNNYYPFWNIPDGSQATIRFLPDANSDNPMGFMVEKLMHTLTINGENKSTPCHKMYNEDCPICKVSSAFYKEDDKINGKKYWRKKQHLAQALILEDPLPPDEATGETHEGKVRFVALGYQIFNIIKDAFESGELDEIPYAFEGGCNFVIKKTKQGDYPSYSLSKFARKSSDLDEDEVALAEEHMVDLSTLLPQAPAVEKTEGMLEAALTGKDYSDESSSAPSSGGLNFKPKAAASRHHDDDDDDDAPFETKPKAAPAKKAAVTESDDDDGYDNEAQDILAQIRARQAAKG